jgi:hypothetical protein
VTRTKSFKEAGTDPMRELARMAAQAAFESLASAVTGALGGGGGALPIAKMGELYTNGGRPGAGSGASLARQDGDHSRPGKHHADQAQRHRSGGRRNRLRAGLQQ